MIVQFFSFHTNQLGLAEHIEFDVLHLDAKVFADELSAGKHSDIA